jgi:hypothetical protein
MHATRTLQETVTSASGPDVLDFARTFFSRRNSVYAAFLEREGDTFATFRGQGGEEIVIAVSPAGGATRVTGSTYLFDQQLARFLATLPPAAQEREA